MAQSVLPFLMVADASFFPQRPKLAPPLRLSSALFAHSSALFYTRAKRISFAFNHPRTLCAKHPGVTKSVFDFLHRLNSRFTLTQSGPLTPVESALTGEFRAGFQGLYLQTLSQQTTEIGRKHSPATPLESALTARGFVTPLESALTKTLGEGGHFVK